MRRRAALGALAAGWLVPPAGRAAATPGLLRHYYWVNGASPAALLSRRARRIDLLSPLWFRVQAGGGLRADLDLELVGIASELKIPLLPVLANEGFRPEVASEVLGCEGEWKRLAAELTQTVLAYGLRGLQVDFEGVAAPARESYVRFVAQLAAALRAHGLLCSVAVGAPLAASPDAQGGWRDGPHAAALDYGALAASVDSMTVMTYDQHATADDPGPVAGRPWVEACVRRLLQSLPASRLLLGIPLYYRRWSGEAVAEGPHAEAVELAARMGAPVRLDAHEVEKTFSFVDRGVRNAVWLHDRDTLRARIALARRLGLAGFSAWRFGHEDAALWQGEDGAERPAAQGANAMSQR